MSKIQIEKHDNMPNWNYTISPTNMWNYFLLTAKRRYILCFNPQLFKDQQQARFQAIENFRGFAKTLNAELLAAKHSRNKGATQKKFDQKMKKLKIIQIKNLMHREKRLTIYTIVKKLTEKTFQVQKYDND